MFVRIFYAVVFPQDYAESILLDTHTHVNFTVVVYNKALCILINCVFASHQHICLWREKTILKMIKVDKIKLKTSNLQKLILLFRGLAGGMAVLCTAQPSQ